MEQKNITNKNIIDPSALVKKKSSLCVHYVSAAMNNIKTIQLFFFFFTKMTMSVISGEYIKNVFLLSNIGLAILSFFST